MKNKRIFSILALALCLPILALVAVGCDLFGKKPESLEIDTSEAKVLYYEGDDFSSEGLVVTAKYKDGTAEEVEDFEVDSSRFDKDEAGDYIVFVSYKGITDGYIVTVKEDVVEDLEVSVENKFFVGQEFKTNAVVTATYTSGKTENVENYSVTSFDKTAVGTQTALIAFGGEEASVEVEVLSNADYVAWVKTKLEANVLSRDDENFTAELRNELHSASYQTEQKDETLKVVNNSSIWSFYEADGQEGGYAWMDFNSNVMMMSFNGLSVKNACQSRMELFSMPLTTLDASGVASMFLDVKFTYAYLVLGDNELFNEEFSSISLANGNLVLATDGSMSVVTIDFKNWMLKEWSGMEIVTEEGEEPYIARMSMKFGDIDDREIPEIPDENWIVGVDVGLKNEKMFKGQEFKTNCVVTASYENGSSAELASGYTFSGYNFNTIGVQEVVVRLGGYSKTVSVEVLSDEDYIDYVATKLQAGVLSVDNVNYTATLSSPIVDGGVYYGQDVVIANDGAIWCLLPEEMGGSMAFDAFWYDIDSNVMYVKIGDVYTQKSFDSYLAGATYLYQTYFSGMGGMNFELFVSIYFYNPQYSYAYYVSSVSSTTLTGSTISLNDGVLTLAQGTEGACIKIDYEKWMLTEVVAIYGEDKPAQITKFGSVSEIQIPAIPDVEWVEV